MKEKEKITPEGIACSPFYSPAIRYGDILYVSGQVGEDATGYVPEGIEQQTELAILNAKKIIESTGGSLDHVLMCWCFLQKKEDCAGMNAAYSKFFGGEHNMAPARYTVEAPPVADKFLVEIAMVVGL